MGNCIVVNKETAHILKTDGEVLDYEAPMEVQKYSLFPLTELQTPAVAKTVQLSNTVVSAGQVHGVVRIKVVISKQELKAMLLKGGVQVDHLLPKLQKAEELNEVDNYVADSKKNYEGWKPALELIPEEN